MKKILFLLTIPLIFSCNNEADTRVDDDTGIYVTPQPAHEDSIIVCDFGFKPYQFNKVKRVELDRNKSQPPKMEAKPPKKGAGVIYLDFDGHNLSGTSWSTNPIGLGYSGLTTDQQKEVVAGVQKDYAGYNVLVTNSESVYNQAPTNKRIRVVVTESWEWFGTVGGVAYVGSFKWGDNTPCFVFSSLLSYDPFSIHKAAAHEAGHTLGLLHKAKWSSGCALEAEYISGFIMGWPYTTTSVFGVGPTQLSCSHIQDDVAMIKQTLNSR